MTKKDYEKIAEVLRTGVRPVQVEPWFTYMVDRLCEVFQADNPRFDSERFKVACELVTS